MQVAPESLFLTVFLYSAALSAMRASHEDIILHSFSKVDYATAPPRSLKVPNPVVQPYDPRTAGPTVCIDVSCTLSSASCLIFPHLSLCLVSRCVRHGREARSSRSSTCTAFTSSSTSLDLSSQALRTNRGLIIFCIRLTASYASERRSTDTSLRLSRSPRLRKVCLSWLQECRVRGALTLTHSISHALHS